ncbi:hypothetical protein [Actinomadura miaoliensis]|uniref:Uncharacterized protein n=1 Tax=Actinomadura miaoliensis TaxID=430685 RepID=A0ABP7W7H7_9ACTN
MSESMLADSKLAKLVAKLAGKSETRPQPEARPGTAATTTAPASGGTSAS